MNVLYWCLAALLCVACEASDISSPIQSVANAVAQDDTNNISSAVALEQDVSVAVQDPLTIDNDGDGFPAFGDCDDADASIHPGLINCPSVQGADKESYKLVLVYDDPPAYTPYMSAIYYKFMQKPEFSSKVHFDMTWLGETFAPKTFVAFDLDKVTLSYTVLFNVADYPSVWTVCEGTLVKKIDLKLTLPKIYLIKKGIWKDVTNKVTLLPASDLQIVDSYDGDTIGLPAKCVAALTL